jgi:multidrug efflux pump subunit AcrA (membrane-fusion protein)
VRTESGQSYVLVVGAENLAERRAVRTAGMDGDRLEVLAGLRAGERVVVSPPADLAAGARVTVKQ